MRFLAALIALLLISGGASAANCGGATTCNCNDSITSSYTQPSNLVCPYDGSSDLSVISSGTPSITYNLNGQRLSGFNATWPIQPYTGWPSGVTDQEDICLNWGGTTSATFLGGSSSGSIDGCKEAIAFQNTNSLIDGQGATINNAGQIGINVNATGEEVKNWIVKGVFGYAIRDVANGANIHNNEITGNFTDVQVNSGYSIYFGGITTGTINNNNIHDNAGVAFFGVPAGVTFSGNTVANEKGGVFGGGVPNLGFDGTNTVDGYPIKIVQSASGTTYDGNSTGNYGYFGCITCTNITLSNMPAIEQVYLSASTGPLINNITISDFTADTNPFRITASSTGGTLQNSNFNRIGSSGAAVIAVAANNWTISNDTCAAAAAACVFVGVGVTGTTIGGLRIINGYFADIDDRGTDTTLTNNLFMFPKPNGSQMIGWNEATRTGTIGTPITYSFNMTDAHGQGVACPTCTYSVVSYPSETVTASAASNVVSGSFTPSKNGTYSLLVTVSDANGNQEVKNFIYLIGSTASQTSRYYYRYGRSGNIVNGLGMDGQPLSLTPPSVDEFAGYCSGWVQDMPMDIPPYPLSELTTLSASVYYTVTQGTTTFGVERFAAYENSIDSGGQVVATPGPYTFTTATPTITGLTYMMDSAASWYGLAIKLVNTPNPRFPEIQSLAASPSYVDFTYLHAATNPVKSLSNALVPVLSSTSAGLSLYNATSATAAQTIVYGGFTANNYYQILLDGVVQAWGKADSSGFLTSSIPIPTGAHTLTTNSFGFDAAKAGQVSLKGNIKIQ